MGLDVPLRLRAHPAQGDRQARLPVELHDLRRRRLQAADDAWCCKDLDLDPRRYQPGAVLHWVSNHKNELRGPEDVAADTHNKFEETYAAAYARYQQRLRDANALDFDDILMLTVDLFATFPEVRETYRRRFRHVLVDEYQDTNHAQYALIHQLCADSLEDPARRSGRGHDGRADRRPPS